MNKVDNFWMPPFVDTVDAKLAAARWSLRLKDCYKSVKGRRAYHNIKHVKYMVMLLEGDTAYLPDLKLATYIAWFHDAVYDTNHMDATNVQKSADLAAEALTEMGVPQSDITYVVGGIQATNGHHPSKVYGAIIDADLQVLAWNWEEYKQYVAAVRREYMQYSDKEFMEGRRAALQSFLARPRLFNIPVNVALLEDHARDNIKAELKLISKHATRYLRRLV